jgi:hypothetical protein
MLLGDTTQEYQGGTALFAHLATHQGAYLDGTQIQGPLMFNNDGAKACSDSEFDVRFPDMTPAPKEQAEPEHGATVVVSSSVSAKPQHAEPEQQSNHRSSYTYEQDVDDNPWAS